MMQGSLAERLRVLRAQHGYTLAQAAAKTGADRGTLSSLERGIHAPYTPTLHKIARGYGVPVEELLEEPVPLGEAAAGNMPHQKLVGKALELAETQGGDLGHHYDALMRQDQVQQYENLILAAFQRIKAGEDQEAVVREYAGFLEEMTKFGGEIRSQIDKAFSASSSASGDDAAAVEDGPEAAQSTEELDIILVRGLSVQGEHIAEELKSSVDTVPMRTLMSFAMTCAIVDRLYEELYYSGRVSEQRRGAKKQLDDTRARVVELAGQLLNPGDASTALTRQLFARRRSDDLAARKAAGAKDAKDFVARPTDA